MGVPPKSSKSFYHFRIETNGFGHIHTLHPDVAVHQGQNSGR